MENVENVVSLQEMSLQEMEEVNGGYGWIDLMKDVLSFACNGGVSATVQIRQEGGITCADMPFK